MTEASPFDPKNSIALIIGVSEYPMGGEIYEPVKAVENNVRDLANLLRDSEIFGFEYVESLLNPPKSEIIKKLKSLQSANEYFDTILVYYCGHGIKVSGEYFITGTDVDHEIPSESSIKFEEFEKYFLTIPTSKRILILDSCYSGSVFKKGLGADADLLDVSIDKLTEEAKAYEDADNRRQGIFAIASADRDVQADASHSGSNYTGFTGVLIKRLNTGFPHDPHLRVPIQELVRMLKVDANSAAIPEPRESDKFGLGSWPLVGNLAARRQQQTVSAEQIAKLEARLLEKLDQQFEEFKQKFQADEVVIDPSERDDAGEGNSPVDPIVRFYNSVGVFGISNMLMLIIFAFLSSRVFSKSDTIGLEAGPSSSYTYMDLIYYFSPVIFALIMNFVLLSLACFLDSSSAVIRILYGRMLYQRWFLSIFMLAVWAVALFVGFRAFEASI